MNTFSSTLVVSIALIVGGFLTPPIGVIDGSVLTAVGLLWLCSVVARIAGAMRAGRSGKVSKGDFTAEVHGPEGA